MVTCGIIRESPSFHITRPVTYGVTYHELLSRVTSCYHSLMLQGAFLPSYPFSIRLQSSFKGCYTLTFPSRFTSFLVDRSCIANIR
jgi:hypothetical protein